MVERILDPQAVESAEYARKNGFLQVAIQFSEHGLGNLEELNLERISRNQEQLAILACLARIQVDARKSRANKSLMPWGVYGNLMPAAQTISTIYNNQDVAKGLTGVTQDHREREHNFLPEMARDRLMVMQAAIPLLSDNEGKEIVQYGLTLLSAVYDTLPEEHSVKPLIGIEIQLAGTALGAAMDKDRLMIDFAKLQVVSQDNPHRIATVASWVVVWGEKLGDSEMAKSGMGVFSKIIEERPEWAFIIEDSREKEQMRVRREKIVRTGGSLIRIETRHKLRKLLINE